MMKTQVMKLAGFLPPKIRDTAFLRLFSFFKIPMIAWTRPVVEELNDEVTRVRIPLNRRTKNHLNSMYFGVLATGADCAGGLVAMKYIQESGKNISLAFKDFNAQFFKRAESDVIFTCTQGKEVKALVETVLNSDERHHFPVEITATCPDKFGSEPVASFILTLSLKKK